MRKRNISVILYDQLRNKFKDLYVGKAIKIPNTDNLAQLDVTFVNTITAGTVCAPARASMMAGRFVSIHNVWTNDVTFHPGMETIAEKMKKKKILLFAIHLLLF